MCFLITRKNISHCRSEQFWIQNTMVRAYLGIILNALVKVNKSVIEQTNKQILKKGSWQSRMCRCKEKRWHLSFKNQGSTQECQTRTGSSVSMKPFHVLQGPKRCFLKAAMAPRWLVSNSNYSSSNHLIYAWCSFDHNILIVCLLTNFG